MKTVQKAVIVVTSALMMIAMPASAQIEISPENRCSPYERDDYPYPQSIEQWIVSENLGGQIISPYTGEVFESDLRILPLTEPQFDPVGLWALQQELLSWAEHLYGPRDASFQLYPPQFDDDGPNIRFTPDRRGVYAELAPNAQRHWRFAVFQLAHETVHLLDPGLLGTATYLEEGVAVAFSLHVQQRYGINVVTNGELYDRAHARVNTLPEGHLETKLIRRAVGRLRNATADNLVSLFPDLAPEIASMLACKFPVH